MAGGEGTEVRPTADPASDRLAVAFSPDGQFLASGSSERNIKVWETLVGHEGSVMAVAFSPTMPLSRRDRPTSL